MVTYVLGEILTAVLPGVGAGDAAVVAAVVDYNAPAIIVDVERNNAVVVGAVLVDEDDDAECSANPSSCHDVRGACTVYLWARDYFSVPG